MKKNGKKVLSACSIASLLITTTAVSTNVKAVGSSENRLGGANRYETAAKISQSGWTTSDYAIVANGEGYADALCASPLAKANNAPILLTTNGSLSQNALDELMYGRTTIVIAHRLSTIKNADRIIVIDDGKVVDSGSHEELFKKDGLYKELYTKQFAVEEA